MTVRPNVKTEVDWLLDDLVNRVAGVDHIVVLSADGLLMGRAKSLSQPDAEHLSAVASGFQSLAKGTGWHFGRGDVYQTVVEMERGFLMVTSAGQGGCLALLASADSDLGMIAYEANRLVTRVGTYLASAPRHPLAKSTVDAHPS
jgi:predicted regulator of Ras-like GTPase activity (Roadblock/LC7/MglB family)